MEQKLNEICEKCGHEKERHYDYWGNGELSACIEVGCDCEKFVPKKQEKKAYGNRKS